MLECEMNNSLRPDSRAEQTQLLKSVSSRRLLITFSDAPWFTAREVAALNMPMLF
jgi:hypothetical protein